MWSNLIHIIRLHSPDNIRRKINAWLNSGCPVAFVLTLMLALVSPLKSAVVKGTVSLQSGDNPIAGAELYIEDLSHGAVADEDGKFLIDAIPAGSWSLTASHLGFDSKEKSFTVGDEDTLVQNFTLKRKVIKRDEVVFTATRTLQLLKNVPIATELVTSKEIEYRAAQTAAEALATEAGIDVSSTFAGQGVTLLGVDPDKVLILVDGNRVIGRVNGSIDLDQISTAGVKQIEIVKGSVSTLYGSEAIGGVINVITAPSIELFLMSADLSIGGHLPNVGLSDADLFGFSSTNYSPAVTFSTKPNRLSIKGAFRHSSIGLIDLNPSTPHTNGTDKTDRSNSNLQFDYDLSENSNLILTGSYMNEAKSWIEDAGLQSVTVSYDDEEDNSRTNTSAEYLIAPNWQERTSIKLYHTRNHHHWKKLTQRYRAVRDQSRGDEDFTELSLMTTRPVSDNHSLTGGADISWWNLEAFSELGGVASRYSSEQLTWDAFLQDEWQPLEKWTFIPGVRFEKHEVYGNHISPRISAMMKPTENIKIRGSVGFGYRAPSAKELFFDFNHASAGYVVEGNPNLKPEESSSYTISIDHNYRNEATARISLFYNDMRNLIDFDSVGATEQYYLGVYRYDNITSAYTRGIEVERSFRVNGELELNFAYTFLESKNRETGYRLIGRKKHSGRWNLTWFRGKWTTKIWGKYEGRSLYTTIWETDDRASSEWTQPYQVWSIAISRDLPRNFSTYLKVDNLLDYYHITYGPWTGRIVTAGVKWNYKLKN